MRNWAWALVASACLLFAGAARADGPTAEREFDDCGGADWCPRMVVVPAGDFQMGSPDREPGRDSDEGPQHRVWLHAFAVGKFEITFAQWDACVADGGCAEVSDAGWGRGQRPVMNVTWDNVQGYLGWLSQKTGQHYRLLSESEWEYAARAGRSAEPFGTGQDIRPSEANYYATYVGHTAPVGSYAPSTYGLYDMHGNVWEMVGDCYMRRYWHAPTDGSARIDGDCEHYKLARGGAWNSNVALLRAANRLRFEVQNKSSALGFRVARSLDQRADGSAPM